MKDAANRGEMVVAVGDFNLKTGDLLTPNPVKTVSRGGRVLVDMLEENDLHCINKLDVNKTEYTHVDRSSNTANVLDYVLTNEPELVQKIEIDGQFKTAPHYTRLRDGVIGTAYSDHCLIYLDIATVSTEEMNKARPKITKWLYGKEGGAEKYREILEEGIRRRR